MLYFQGLDSRRRTPNTVRLPRVQRLGAAVVEFAVVTPIFFLLVMGIVEYGRMVMVQQVITNASRVGARAAVLDGSTTANVQSVVDTYHSSASISGAVVAISPNPPSTAADGTPMTVTVTIGFSQVSWLPSPMYLGSTTLQARSVMRRERIE